MHSSFRYLLPVLLLCGPLRAQADDAVVGDFWIIHHQGKLSANELFVADGDPGHIISRSAGVQSLGVYQVYESAGRATLTSYDVEVDCARNKVRVKDAQDFNKFAITWTPRSVSHAWQEKPNAWLSQSRDFVCKPDERSSRMLSHMGRMSIPQMINNSQKAFNAVGRQQVKAAVLKKIDEAFDRMPKK
ncbi:hypothetical protein [Achromobacter xylosoxidans]|uniref:hypothetical protein n=1 Tax=Alcaligenes xylosoxydans xylosoxydans TaxID=85698 RepID=UPI0006C1D605|nr:hypothetical protein [Achromobacter xylosoxidans]MCH1984804.1 hypothetical protein [Achromobacter xylosoxidans]MCH1992708.1 hypothetical protein [Achromobacter xylosoxidans]MCH4584471.1 hypothetical protein [Achromobacter xylosoxidans]OFL31441.1 hypothetical protein HMPREF2772_11225 [Achromobacter xylosoxidans]OFS31463.1 hypothetical protein HMPREF3069_29170 [Achromobacter xylosoxidans]